MPLNYGRPNRKDLLKLLCSGVDMARLAEDGGTTSKEGEIDGATAKL